MRLKSGGAAPYPGRLGTPSQHAAPGHTRAFTIPLAHPSRTREHMCSCPGTCEWICTRRDAAAHTPTLHSGARTPRSTCTAGPLHAGTSSPRGSGGAGRQGLGEGRGRNTPCRLPAWHQSWSGCWAQLGGGLWRVWGRGAGTGRAVQGSRVERREQELRQRVRGLLAVGVRFRSPCPFPGCAWSPPITGQEGPGHSSWRYGGDPSRPVPPAWLSQALGCARSVQEGGWRHHGKGTGSFISPTCTPLLPPPHPVCSAWLSGATSGRWASGLDREGCWAGGCGSLCLVPLLQSRPGCGRAGPGGPEPPRPSPALRVGRENRASAGALEEAGAHAHTLSAHCSLWGQPGRRWMALGRCLGSRGGSWGCGRGWS